jgi:hypothetical protein
MLARVIIFWALLLLSCGYALVRGRKYERLAAIVFLAASLVSFLAHLSLGRGYVAMNGGEIAVDSAVLIAVVAIALASDRFWPLWVAGLQLVDSLAHILKAISTGLPPWAYAIAERFWSYPILVILFIGAWRQHGRTIADREAASWSREILD